MVVIPGVQPDEAGMKLSFDTLDSVRSLGEIPRKVETVVRMGHRVGRGTRSPLERGCAILSRR